MNGLRLWGSMGGGAIHMDEDEGNYPNARTRAAIEELDENHGSLPAYSSSDELFADMDIDV